MDARTKSPLLAALLAFVAPGAGHVYASKARRGVAFLVALGLLFGLGVALHARLALPTGFDDPLGYLRWAAQVAIGGPYALARLIAEPLGRPIDPGYDYGNTFTEVAGLLNLLVALDAADTAAGRRR
ncbi:MAG: hypothetical protein KJ067_21745 [Vicinamibacteria bacterium]|nr:hypothetical protein [Vicinamibacteria bacterium]